MSAKEPILSARGIVNRFGKQTVHRGVSIDVERGEVHGIAGGSGAGKSVLLRTLFGMHWPDAGTIRVEGRKLADIPDDEKGFLFGVLCSSTGKQPSARSPSSESQASPGFASYSITGGRRRYRRHHHQPRAGAHPNHIVYRIHFNESVSGLALGDPVKLRGVEVGKVRALSIDKTDLRLVEVDVELRKEAPVKTNTKASLEIKGITGGQYIELDGGTPETPRLAEATASGSIPEISYEKSQLAGIIDRIPIILDKFSAIETKTAKVLTDVGQATGHIKEAASDVKETTSKIKENPALLLKGILKGGGGGGGEKAQPPTDPGTKPQ